MQCLLRPLLLPHRYELVLLVDPPIHRQDRCPMYQALASALPFSDHIVSILSQCYKKYSQPS